MSWLVALLLFFSAHNQIRADAGVCPLAWDANLTVEAVERAEHEASLGYLSHEGFPSFSYAVGAGENLGRTVYDPALLLPMFEASPTHYANMIEPRYDRVGIGFTHGADGYTYVAILFEDIDGAGCHL